jgi:alpha-glucosidase (family GH31 glycosyl hydrolase)
LWYDFYSNKTYNGNNSVVIDVTLDRIPVFVKSGSFIPMLNDYQTTDVYPDDIINMHYYPAELNTTSEYELFEDDGSNANSLEEGLYQISEFVSSNSEETLSISFSRKIGHYLDDKDRRLRFVIHHLEEFPEKLQINNEDVNVFHIMQMPAVTNISAKFDPQEMKLYISLPWDQTIENQIEITK